MKRRTLLKVLGGTAGATAGAPLVGSRAFAGADVGLRRTSRLSREPTEEIPSLCDFCFWRCGILAKVRNGRIVRIQGNPDHPRSRGRLCSRGIAGKYQVEDDDRLKYPLRRVGKRGEGKWERISWDEAIALWASKTGEAIEKHGPGSIGVFSHGLSSRFINSFMLHLGNPNRTVPSFGQCRGPRDVGFELTFGEGPGSPARHDMARSKMIVLFGCHIGENVQTGQVAEFAEAIDRGARVVVVDPRMSVSASKSDRWLRIRPGTDTALLLCWINIFLREKLYDKEYVQHHTSGLDQLTREVSRYTPEWAAEVTQLPRDAIVFEARQMAQRKPAVMIHCGRFSTWYGNDTQRSRAMAILTALLGAWGRPGGYYRRSGIPLGPLPCPKSETGMGSSVATGHYPFTHFGVAAQELIEASVGQSSPIRQWLFYAVNPLQSLPGQGRIREAMQSLDFITMVDIIPTEGALWADLILPEASYLERHDDILAVADHPRPFVALRQPVVPPRFEAREPYWIVQQLAHKMGHIDCFTHESVTEYLDARLAPCGTTYEELARKGIFVLPEQQPFFDVDDPICFETPSSKIELYSSALASVGEDPVPKFEPVEQPDIGWFRLVAGRTPYHSFARTQNIPRLLHKDSENALWINAEVAAAKGLSNGDAVYLQNLDGYRTGPIRVLTTQAIRTDIVYTVHGYGCRSHVLREAHAQGVSDNALTSRFEPDSPTGCTGIRVNFVRLVTEDGKEIEGVTDACGAERKPFPELPDPSADARVEPRGDEQQKPDDPVPHPSIDPDGFFKVKLEDGC